MKKKIILIMSILCLCLTACGKENNNVANNTVENNNVETVTESVSNVDQTRPDIKIANVWMKLPKNVDLHWRTDEKNSTNYSTTDEYKRDNNIFKYSESVENGVRITAENNAIKNEFYYYNYLGDYKWSSYVYFHNQGWDTWYFNGVYPASPQCYCMGRPYTILDNYSNTHETIHIDGVGDVDTVVGTLDEGNGREFTVYYSKDLGMNVKIENSVQSWYLTEFNTNVSPEFPHQLPDMEALAKNKE
jgi:hypothetical protein